MEGLKHVATWRPEGSDRVSVEDTFDAREMRFLILGDKFQSRGVDIGIKRMPNDDRAINSVDLSNVRQPNVRST